MSGVSDRPLNGRRQIGRSFSDQCMRELTKSSQQCLTSWCGFQSWQNAGSISVALGFAFASNFGSTIMKKQRRWMACSSFFFIFVRSSDALRASCVSPSCCQLCRHLQPLRQKRAHKSAALHSVLLPAFASSYFQLLRSFLVLNGKLCGCGRDLGMNGHRKETT